MRHFVLQICDRVQHPIVISIIGFLGMSMSFLFLSPAPFVATTLSVRVTNSMILFAGLGMGFVVISTFCRCQQIVIQSGFDDSIATYMQMSGKRDYIFSL